MSLSGELNRPVSMTEEPCAHCTVRDRNVCQGHDSDRQTELYESRRTWASGRLLFREGDPAGPVFKIITGIVAVSKRLSKSRRQIVDFLFPGEICGYVEADGRYAFEGRAVTPVETCVFSRERFDAFTARHDDLREVVRTTLGWKLERVGRHTATVGQLFSIERVAAFLCWLRARYEEYGMETTPLALPMSRTAIGEHLGLRLETVSHVLAELDRLRIIEAGYGEVVILDLSRLSALSGWHTPG
jgi:CRP/FNR family transcriptional regulator